MASPHLPQQMLSVADSGCGLKAKVGLSPAPDCQKHPAVRPQAKPSLGLPV